MPEHFKVVYIPCKAPYKCSAFLIQLRHRKQNVSVRPSSASWVSWKYGSTLYGQYEHRNLLGTTTTTLTKCITLTHYSMSWIYCKPEHHN